jgi:hypothetical protein
MRHLAHVTLVLLSSASAAAAAQAPVDRGRLGAAAAAVRAAQEKLPTQAFVLVTRDGVPRASSEFAVALAADMAVPFKDFDAAITCTADTPRRCRPATPGNLIEVLDVATTGNAATVTVRAWYATGYTRGDPLGFITQRLSLLREGATWRVVSRKLVELS